MRFRDKRTFFILDKSRSTISKKDIKKYRSEVTKIKNSPVCSSYTTAQVSDIGIRAMEKRHYRLIEGQLDV